MKIVINRSDAIGDTILTIPMANVLKNKFPDSHITFIISKKCTALLIDHPTIDNFWVLDHKKTWPRRLFSLLKLFLSLKPDTYFHVGGGHLPSLAAWLKRVKFRGGLKSKWQTFFLLNRGVRQKRSMVEMHESDYNINLLKPLEIKYDYNQREQFKPTVNLKEYNELDSMFGEKELVFVHPGMTGHTLNWPSRNYARFISRLENIYPDRFTYVVSHTPEDARFMETITNELEKDENLHVKDKVVYFDGSLKGLEHYMFVLSKAALFVGPSTGTTHIANMLGIKLIALYSPIKVQSALRWGPYTRDNKTKIIVPNVVCGEQFFCNSTICPYHECMSLIEVDEVIEAAEYLL